MSMKSKRPKPTADQIAAARSVGQHYGQQGGKARARKLSPAKRSAQARKAAQARWGKRTP